MLNWLRRLFGFSSPVPVALDEDRVTRLYGIMRGTGPCGAAATEAEQFLKQLPTPDVVAGGTLGQLVTPVEIATIEKKIAKAEDGTAGRVTQKPVHSLGMKFVPLTTKASKSRKKRVSEAVSLAPEPSGPDPLAGLVLAEVFMDTAFPTTYDSPSFDSPSFSGGDGGSSGGGGGEVSWDSGGGSSDFGGGGDGGSSA